MPGTESVTYRSPTASAEAANSRDGRCCMVVVDLAGIGSECGCALGHWLKDGGSEREATNLPIDR
jgi:hypothetical protein